jgi:SAM-dependent methyltransferase
MPTPTPTPLNIEQHNTEIHENLKHWNRKPLLRQQYQIFYNEIAKSLIDIPDGPILECGSGIGNLKSVLPQAITSDLFPNPWLDRQENIYALNFGDNSLSGIVLFDVFHHLEYPGTALKELHRVLKPGGRVVIFEPAMGLLGRIALGLFHHEPLGLNKPITWEAPTDFNPNQTNYYAAQGNAWRIFRERKYQNMLAQNNSLKIQYYTALAWLMSGGFRGPQLCPIILTSVIYKIDQLIGAVFPEKFASRLLICLMKKSL